MAGGGFSDAAGGNLGDMAVLDIDLDAAEVADFGNCLTDFGHDGSGQSFEDGVTIGVDSPVNHDLESKINFFLGAVDGADLENQLLIGVIDGDA